MTFFNNSYKIETKRNIMNNYLEPKFLAIVKKLIKSKRCIMTFEETYYVNKLSLREQILLMEINPKIINSFHNQTEDHFNFLITCSRLPEGIKINLPQCSLENAIKLTKRSKHIYDANFMAMDNNQIHMIGLKNRSRHRFLKLSKITPEIRLFALKDDFYNLNSIRDISSDDIDAAIDGFHPFKSKSAYFYFDNWLKFELSSIQLKKLHDKILKTTKKNMQKRDIENKEKMINIIKNHKNWKNVAELILETLKNQL